MFTAEIKSRKDEDICILVKIANHSYNYICDCGEANALGVKDCQNTRAILISHAHIDHFVNFDTILRHQLGIGEKVVICGPEGIIHQVQNRIKSYRWNLIEEGSISYEIREITGNDTMKAAVLNPPSWEITDEKILKSSIAFSEKDFYVEFEILNHKTDSISYLFKALDKVKIELDDGFRGGKWVAELKKAYETNNRNAIIEIDGKEYLSKDMFYMMKLEKGKRLGIIMDHAASPENHEKIKRKFLNADEVYIECFFKDEDKEYAEKNFHSYASMSGKIMKEAKVKKAVPVHFSRKYNEKEIEELIAQFEMANRLRTDKD